MPDTFISESAHNPDFVGTETSSERLRRTRHLSFRRWARAFFYDVLSLFHEARVPLIGFFIVMASGTFYWTTISTQVDYRLGRALFETMRMLVLEHGEDFPPDLLGQILFFAIPIFGLAFVFQGVLDFGRLLLDKSGRLEGWQISQARTYQNHIIVCGLGRVSYRLLLRLLESGYEIVVIEQDWESEFVQDALALKVPVIHGDGRRGRVLRQAGVFRARGLVTAISNDLINIEVALAAKRMRSDMLIVLRIFNEQLDYSLEHSQFGRNTAFSSSALAAPTLAAASVCMGIKYALPLPEAQLAISDITVTAGSTLDSLVYKIERQFNVQVICYTGENSAGEMQWRHRVSPTTRLYGGDRIKLLGTLPALGAVWKHGHVSNKIMDTLGISIPQQPTPQYNRVIVCGLGKVGYRVVKALYYTEPRPEIVVICSGETRERFVKEIRELGIEVRLGDARTAEELEAAGIDHAYAVAAVTSDNLTNLRISLTARQLRDDIHVVVRVFSDVLADHLEALFGIHTTFSTSALAAPTLAAAVVVRDTGYAVDIGEQLLSVARLTVSAGDEFDGQQISALREHRAIVVVTVRRGSRMFVMPHDPDYPDRLFERPLQPGDEIVVMAEIHTIARLRSLGAETAISDIGSSRMMPERLSRATRLADTNCITAPHLAAVGGNGSAHQPPTDTEEILQRLLSTNLPPDELSGTAQRVAAGKTKE